MILAAMAMACVMYTDGTQHCDIRTKDMASFATREDCRDYMQDGAFNVSQTALADADVKEVTVANGNCYPTIEIRDIAVRNVKLLLDARNFTYVHTRY